MARARRRTSARRDRCRGSRCRPSSSCCDATRSRRAPSSRSRSARSPAARQALGGDIAHRALDVVLDGDESSAGPPGVERRPLLPGERVRRDVIGGERQRLPEVVVPRGQRLPGHGEDEVEAHVVEAGRARRTPPPRACLVRGMVATQRAQQRLLERLCAERQPVDAGGAVGRQALRRERSRIGLQRDLGVCAEAERRARRRSGRRRWPATAATACRRRGRPSPAGAHAIPAARTRRRARRSRRARRPSRARRRTHRR